MGITRREFVSQMGAGVAIVVGVRTLPTPPTLPSLPSLATLPTDRSPNWLIRPSQPCVRVIGVGGAGTLVLDRMAKIGHAGIDLITVDTDAQNLRFRQAGAKLLIGEAVPRGLCEGAEDGSSTEEAQPRRAGSAYTPSSTELMLSSWSQEWGVAQDRRGWTGTLVLDRMAKIGHAGIDLITVDTDAQNLRFRQAGAKLLIGEAVPRGLCGGGGRVEYGRGAAEESRQRLHAVLDGADVVVVVAGMGGGTGTGAAPVVAEVARRLGALTLGVVSLPFEFEGRRHRRQAASGVRELADRLDTTVVVPSYALVPQADSAILFRQVLERVDELMLQATQSLTVPLVQPGLINIGCADYRALFNRSGPALVAAGVSDGEHRARGAAQVLLEHPVLDGVDLRRASAALVTIATGVGDDNLTICEIDEIGTVLHESLGDALQVLTNVQDPTLGRGCRVTLTALGLDKVLGQDPEPC